jgi:FAD/FMN-containing dehydrogenase
MYLGFDSPAKELFGVNTERLVSLKKQYDPHNIFNKFANLLQ